MKTEKEFEEYINNLTMKELLELLRKHNLTYPIELSAIDEILKEVEPVELTEETKQMFLRTMRKTAKKLWGKEGEMSVESENIILRRLLWLRHGCPQSFLYGDDGEMQCHQCMLDFKRMSAIEIENRFYELNLLKLKGG